MSDKSPNLNQLLLAGDGQNPAQVRAALRSTGVIGFGHVASSADANASNPFQLLTFTIPGGDHSYVPVFTEPSFVGKALEVHPEWGQWPLLEVAGSALLDHSQPKSVIVLNPWSELEFHL